MRLNLHTTLKVLAATLTLSLASCASLPSITTSQPVSVAPFRSDRAPASIWSSCQEIFRSIIPRRAADEFLTRAETQALREKLARVARDYHGVSVPEDRALYIASENFDAAELETLCRVADGSTVARYANPEELHQRLSTVAGGNTTLFGFFDQFEGIYSSAYRNQSRGKPAERAEAAFHALRNKVEEAGKKSDQAKQVLQADLGTRQKLAALDRHFEDARLFSVQIQNGQALFPNGRSYPLLKQHRDGTVVVGIPYSQILTTQTYYNPQIGAAYRNDPALKKMEFDGAWMPDGRVLIVDQHHRTKAYQEVFGEKIPFVLKPDGNGQYRTQSYLHAMKFYTSWMGVPEARKFQLLERIETIRASERIPVSEQDRLIRDLLESVYLGSLKLKSLTQD